MPRKSRVQGRRRTSADQTMYRSIGQVVVPGADYLPVELIPPPPPMHAPSHASASQQLEPPVNEADEQ